MGSKLYYDGAPQYDEDTDYQKIYFIVRRIQGSYYGIDDEPVFQAGYCVTLKSSNDPREVVSLIPEGYFIEETPSDRILFDNLDEPVWGRDLIRYEVEVTCDWRNVRFYTALYMSQAGCQEVIRAYNTR